MSNKDKLRMAVIGVGNMGRRHARDVHELANTELVAVCNTGRDKADEVAAPYGVKAYYDYRDLLAGAGVQAILVATPHHDHTPISIDALEQGIHVLVEKPIAVHAKDARRMEVEDEVAAFFEHEDGMVGHFVTSTAESPGTNRLEIVGEQGKLVLENETLTFWRNRGSMLRFIEEAAGGFDKVEHAVCDVPFQHHGQPGHRLIIENFANSVRGEEALIAPAVEGYQSVMLGNAIMLSSFLNSAVDLPIDEDLYEAKLRELIQNSRYQKTTRDAGDVDMDRSFG